MSDLLGIRFVTDTSFRDDSGMTKEGKIECEKELCNMLAEAVRKVFHNEYLGKDADHDYIENPKDSGYQSIHLHFSIPRRRSLWGILLSPVRLLFDLFSGNRPQRAGKIGLEMQVRSRRMHRQGEMDPRQMHEAYKTKRRQEGAVLDQTTRDGIEFTSCPRNNMRQLQRIYDLQNQIVVRYKAVTTSKKNRVLLPKDDKIEHLRRIPVALTAIDFLCLKGEVDFAVWETRLYAQHLDRGKYEIAYARLFNPDDNGKLFEIKVVGRRGNPIKSAPRNSRPRTLLYSARPKRIKREGKKPGGGIVNPASEYKKGLGKLIFDIIHKELPNHRKDITEAQVIDMVYPIIKRLPKGQYPKEEKMYHIISSCFSKVVEKLNLSVAEFDFARLAQKADKLGFRYRGFHEDAVQELLTAYYYGIRGTEDLVDYISMDKEDSRGPSKFIGKGAAIISFQGGILTLDIDGRKVDYPTESLSIGSAVIADFAEENTRLDDNRKSFLLETDWNIYTFTGNMVSRSHGAVAMVDDSGNIFIDSQLWDQGAAPGQLTLVHEALEFYFETRGIEFVPLSADQADSLTKIPGKTIEGLIVEGKLVKEGEDYQMPVNYYLRYFIQNKDDYEGSVNQDLTRKIRMIRLAAILGITLEQLYQAIGKENHALAQAIIHLLIADKEVQEEEIRVILKEAKKVEEAFALADIDDEEKKRTVALYMGFLALEELMDKATLPELFREFGNLGSDLEKEECYDKDKTGGIFRKRYFESYLNLLRRLFAASSLNQIDSYKFLRFFLANRLGVGETQYLRSGDKINDLLKSYMREKRSGEKIVDLLARYLTAGEQEEFLAAAGVEEAERTRIKERIDDFIRIKELDDWAAEEARARERVADESRVEESEQKSREQATRLLTREILDREAEGIGRIRAAGKLYQEAASELEESLGGRETLDNNKPALLVRQASLWLGLEGVGIASIRKVQESLDHEQYFLCRTDEEREAMKAYLDSYGVTTSDDQYISEEKYKDIERERTTIIAMVDYELGGRLTPVAGDRVISGNQNGADVMLMERMALIMAAVADPQKEKEIIKDRFRVLLRHYYRGIYGEQGLKELLARTLENIVEDNGVWKIILPPMTPFVKEYYDTLNRARTMISHSA